MSTEKCNACGNEHPSESLKLCSRCQTVRYCSVECQKKNWPSHKKECAQIATRALLQAINEDDTKLIEHYSTMKDVVNGKVDYKAPGRAEPWKKWTPIHECVRLRKSSALGILIQGGVANLDIRDGDGETPVFVVAAVAEDSTPLRLLLDAGATPNSEANDGFSALMMAIRDALVDNVKVLLAAGVDPFHGSDMFGRGALDISDFSVSGGGGMRMREGERVEDVKARQVEINQLLRAYIQSYR